MKKILSVLNMPMKEWKKRQQLKIGDIQFHLAIAKATHNDLLAYMSKMLVLPLQQSIQVTSLRPNLQGLAYQDIKLLTAIEKKICSFPRQSDSYVFDELYRAGKVELEW
jgi:DNA-binding FadR family transcriptional regulator